MGAMTLDQALATLAEATRKVRDAFGRVAPPAAFEEALVLSASHAIRWREAHLRENAPVPGRATRFVGAGGLPLWDEGLLRAAQAAGAGVRKVVLQQDFRFGNAVLAGVAGATLIDRQLINPLADRLCKTRGDLALNRLMAVDNTLVVPWSLLGLRSHWRPDARRFHPVWTIEEHFGTPSAWEAMLDPLPARGPEGARADGLRSLDVLFCDAEFHPSVLGCFWLSLVADGRRADTALAQALDRLAALAANLAPAPGAPPLPVAPGGSVARLPLSLQGTGFAEAVGARMAPAGDPAAGRAAAIEAA